MAYTKTTWVDRAVEFARRFTKSGETSTSVTLTQDPGVVTQAGTPVTAANLNKIEQGIADALRKDESGTIALTNAFLRIGLAVNGGFASLASSSNTPMFNLNATNTTSIWNRDDITKSALSIQKDTNGNIVVFCTPAGANPIVWNGPYTVWHSGNDGAGSGLDADLLDGLSSLGFVKADGTVAMTGGLTVPTIGQGSAIGQKHYVFDNGTIKVGFGVNLSAAPDRELSAFHSSSDGANGKLSWGYRLESNGTYTERMSLDGAGTLVRKGTTVPEIRDNSGVLEFFTSGTWRAVGGVKNVQRGTVTVPIGGTANITITSVVMGKTIVNVPGAITSTSNASTSGSVYAELTSATNVRFTNTDASFAYTLSYEVEESY